MTGKEIVVLIFRVGKGSKKKRGICNIASDTMELFPVLCAMCINLAMFHASVSMFYVHLLFNGPISDVHQIWFGIAEKSGREGEKLCGGFQALRDEQLDRKVETNTNSHFGQQ